ncbi:MAG TPA: UDP-3-O-acyl-N-acetylglucosamine deacetylase [Thermohalobaculum sp.]|nr:UDP-3-O-acyl-N-acetylglucosamine deacetylase [Thermohalobaculum sp.]
MMHSTVNNAVKFRGIGLHSGRSVMLCVAPAPAKSGIIFHRTDAGFAARPILARYDFVASAQLCTRLANSDGLSVSTVEHLLAALVGCGITDASISLDGPEVPIMDGSAVEFVRGFARVGIRNLGVPCRAIRMLEPILVTVDDKMAQLSPAPQFEMDFSVCFSDPAIGKQSKRMTLTGGAIVSELSDSRTFGCLADVETLRRKGLGRGGCLDNAVIVDNGRVLNPDGLRHPDEFVRHKMLDAVGDLALTGAPIIGRYTGVKAGHDISNLLLRKLFLHPNAWEWCDLMPGQMPGGAFNPPAARVLDAPIAV